MISSDKSFTSLDSASAKLHCLDFYAENLQDCRNEKNLVSAKTLHTQLCNNGVDIWLDNLIVPMFVDCGDVINAHQVFSQSSNPSEYAWNSIVQGFVTCGKPHLAIDLYDNTQADYANSNRYTFVALLKACARLQNGPKGRQLRAELAAKGYKDDPFVGSALVYMYAKCGFIEEAQEIFDQLPVRDVVTWNALLTGYVEHGLGDQALHFINQMESEGVCPDEVTYLCTLKTCITFGLLRRAMELHVEMVKAGLDAEPAVGNTLVHMYSKSGLLEEAQTLFNELPVQDVISWTALITGCGEHGHEEQALLYLQKMQSKGLSPDGITLASSLKACSKIMDTNSGQEVHTDIVKKGVDQDPFVGNATVDMYMKCRAMEEAEEVFMNLLEQDTVSWNTLIAGYVEEDLGEEVFSCLDKMHATGVYLDDVTFVSCLKACGTMKAPGWGQELHTEIIMKGYETDPFVSSCLVDMHAKCGMLNEARQIFDKSPRENIVLWNSLIAGYVEKGHTEEAMDCLEQMQRVKISLDSITFVLKLKTLARVHDHEHCQQAHMEIVTRGLESEFHIANSLVDLYARYGLLDEAQNIFDRLAVRNLVSWHAIIAGYADYQCEKRLLDSLDQMLVEGLFPDSVTMSLILKGFGQLGDIEKGQQIHDYIIKMGYEEDAMCANALVGMYAAYGLLEELQCVFEQVGFRDVRLWTTLLAGYAELCLDEKVLVCFETLQAESILPDAIALGCIMKACANTGAIIFGQTIHGSIIRRGLEKETTVCHILENMYIKFGLLTDAQSVAENVSCSSCNATGNDIDSNDEGFYDVDHLKEMQVENLAPDDITYVLFLEASTDAGAQLLGRECHIEIVKKGFDGNPTVNRALVDMYAKRWLLSDARKVLDDILVPDVISWTALIKGYTECGDGEEALKCLEQMCQQGAFPDVIIFSNILKFYASIRDKIGGLQVHCEIVKKGFEWETCIGISLVDMYAMCGSFSDAQDVYDRLLNQDAIASTTLITGFIEHKMYREALARFEKMQQEGMSPNYVTISCTLKACGVIDNSHFGQAIHAKVIKRGYETDLVVGNSVLFMCAHCGLLSEALQVFKDLPNRDVASWNALIEGYANHGFAKEAVLSFQSMLFEGISADVILWDTLIRVHVEHGESEDAFSSYMQMQEQGVLPDSLIFMNIVKACSGMAAVELGTRIHAQMRAIRDLNISEAHIATALIDMYGKFGSMADTQCLFDTIPGKVPGIWNALLKSYARQGDSTSAFRLFEEMIQGGVGIDEITALNLFCVCCHGGFVCKGQHMFETMSRDLQISLSVKHYTCIIDLLGRAGHVEEALTVINQLLFQVDASIRNSVLVAWHKWDVVELGKQVIDFARGLDKEEMVSFTLMSNIAASKM